MTENRLTTPGETIAAPPTSSPAPDSASATKSTEVSSADLFGAVISGYGTDSSEVKACEEGKREFEELFRRKVHQVVAEHPCAADYNIAVIYDNSIMIKSDSDQIYRAISKFTDRTKPLMLVLTSRGGEPGSAYLIGQLCREHSNGKLVVVVPRHAKSAATLLATAADEIHMGSLSELGPIDPQMLIDDTGERAPALGLKHSVEHIADLVSNMPGSATMFAKYLHLSVKPIMIGYYERVAKSAAQYAEKLLNTHSKGLKTSTRDIADRLLNGYKDHGFVIDKAEATDIFGDLMIKQHTPEYMLGNGLYMTFSEVERFADWCDHSFFFIGALDSVPVMRKKKQR